MADLIVQPAVVVPVPVLVTLDIIYRVPNSSLLKEFIWQCDDVMPSSPRICRFFLHWRDNIDAQIHAVTLGWHAYLVELEIDALRKGKIRFQ